MNIKRLQYLVDKSINEQPPELIFDFCEPYYSPYYFLAYLLSKEFNDGVYIELGCEKGRFLNSLALGSDKARIFGIDSYIRPELLNLEKFFNVTILHCSSLPSPAIFRSVNILHIDTEHSEAQASGEFNNYSSFLNDGAVVLFDDLHAKDDEVMRYFMGLPYEKIEDDKLHPSCGYGVLIYRKENGK